MKHLLSSASPPFGVWGQRSVCFGAQPQVWTVVTKPEVLLKLSDYQAVKHSWPATHTHTHTHTHTLAVSPSQAKQEGALWFRGLAAPGRWICSRDNLWSSLISRHLSLSSLALVPSSLILSQSSSPLSRGSLSSARVSSLSVSSRAHRSLVFSQLVSRSLRALLTYSSPCAPSRILALACSSHYLSLSLSLSLLRLSPHYLLHASRSLSSLSSHLSLLRFEAHLGLLYIIESPFSSVHLVSISVIYSLQSHLWSSPQVEALSLSSRLLSHLFFSISSTRSYKHSTAVQAFRACLCAETHTPLVGFLLTNFLAKQ